LKRRRESKIGEITPSSPFERCEERPVGEGGVKSMGGGE